MSSISSYSWVSFFVYGLYSKIVAFEYILCFKNILYCHIVALCEYITNVDTILHYVRLHYKVWLSETIGLLGKRVEEMINLLY